MRKVLKKLLKFILYLIFIIFILIFLLLIIINNKKFTVYEDNHHDFIVLFNERIEIFPKLKISNENFSFNWYEYVWYGLFNTRRMNMEFEWKTWEKYENSDWKLVPYLKRSYIGFSLEALRYSKRNHNNMDLIDNIWAILNINTEIWYYENWQTWYVNNYLVNNLFGDKVFDWKQIGYFGNGRTFSISNYDNWILNGEYIEYDEMGIKIKECIYSNWVWDCKIYNESGDLEREAIFNGLDEILSD